jgi:hypothetical protein
MANTCAQIYIQVVLPLKLARALGLTTAELCKGLDA